MKCFLEGIAQMSEVTNTYLLSPSPDECSLFDF